jgi:hypothetical protein
MSMWQLPLAVAQATCPLVCCRRDDTQAGNDDHHPNSITNRLHATTCLSVSQFDL